MMAAAKRKSAFFSATEEAQKQVEQENTVKPSSSDTVPPINRETVSQPQGDTLPPSSSVTAIPLSSDTVVPSQSETVIQQQSRKVKTLNSTTVKKEVKVSFYLTPEQEQKLDDLAYEHKKRTGKRINRNDIVRHLVDHCSIEDLQNIE
jgi:hypothetical protein